MKLCVSGYNGGTIPSIGIFNIDNGCALENCWSGYVENCSYLCKYEDYLFGISELEENSYIHMFKMNGKNYSYLDKKMIKGGSLCHISYLPQNRILTGACYGSGEIFTVRINENSFGEMVSYIRQGENTDKTTRAHCVVPNRMETIIYSANIALDTIYSYKVKSGELLQNDKITLPKEEGPRHILLSPDEEVLYVITEYSNKIHTIRCVDGKMTLIDSVSTLPKDFCGESYGSSICMTANGKFIYGANRGANTIAVFTVLEDGKLRKVEDCSCFGDWPRHISLVKEDSFLAIANQNSNEAVLCKLDPGTGLLTQDVINIKFDNVSYVCEALY